MTRSLKANYSNDFDPIIYFQVIPSTSMNQSIRPWIDLSNLGSSRYVPSFLENRVRNSNPAPSTGLRFATPPTRSSTIHQVIDISDSENDDCVIIDQVRQTPETIVLDDSDTESCPPNVPKSPEPIPSTSGYCPSTSTACQDDKSILVLPSKSTYNDTKSSCMNTKPESNYLSTHVNKRSPSIASVISTDNSIIGSELSYEPCPSKKRKTKSKQKVSKRSRPYFYTSSETSLSDSSHSDWEESHRKKKRTKKHSDKCDKKSKKRRKSDRCKSVKRRKVDDSDEYRETRKSRRTPSKRKLRSSKETTEDLNSHSSATSSSAINKPKLRSVVKVVEKYKEKTMKSCSESDDAVPGTSFGMANGDRKLNSLIVRRNTFSSDSD